MRAVSSRRADRDLDVDDRPGLLAMADHAAGQDVEDADARRPLRGERHVARADARAHALADRASSRGTDELAAVERERRQLRRRRRGAATRVSMTAPAS